LRQFISSFIWNVIRGKFQQGEGGYSAEWKNLGYNQFKWYIIGQYERAPKTTDDDSQHQNFEKQWPSYSADVFLSYFWQQAPEGIVNWAARRNIHHIISMANVIGIGLGLIFSVIFVLTANMGWTALNTWIAVIAVLVTFMLYKNAQYARTEAWQIVDLWLADVLNPQLHTVLDDIRKRMAIDTEKETATTERVEHSE
jgi:hypothetical protein